MTTAQALAVIWVATMITLGWALQARKDWKARHDIDHEIMVGLGRLLETVHPTKQTFDLLAQMNDDPNSKIKMALFGDPMAEDPTMRVMARMKGDEK